MDERPAKLLGRLPDGPRKEAILHAVKQVQTQAKDDQATLSAEFGAETLALICTCNQFLRVHRTGEDAGFVELRLSDEDQATLAEHVELLPAKGTIFQMFGWRRFDPAKVNGLEAWVRRAYEVAKAKGVPKV